MKRKTQQTIIDDYDYIGNSASARDCTGLIPTAPQSASELKSYEDLYHYRPPHIQAIADPEAESEG